MRVRRPRRGAALLTALLTMALVATLAAAGLWQQWRAVEVETAERARAQSAWVLTGALDWARLILREDARAGGVDHLAEPWAVPLQEARLSTFLAAERGADTEGTVVDQAFLSGEIIDLQSRLNINSLVEGDRVSEPALGAFQRLFDTLGLPPSQVETLAASVRQAGGGGRSEGSADSGGGSGRPNATGPVAALGPLMPRHAAQLGWLGLPPATVAALLPYVTVLPGRTPVNLNTASPQVIQAVLGGISLADAQRLVAARESAHFRTLADALRVLGDSQVSPAEGLTSVGSRFFEVRGRLRLDTLVVEERTLVRRDGTDVRTLQRERGVLTGR